MNNQRYLRNNLVDWFSQETLQKMNIGIVGCGAVGNEVIKNLALLGVGKLDVYDLDRIEIHNLTRSILFRESDIGRYKSDVAAQRAMEIDPNIIADAYHGDFWDEMSLDKLRAYDVLISCVDNFETRLRINRLCATFFTDLIDTGIDSRFATVEIYPFSKRMLIACYECNLPPSVYTEIEKRYSCGWLRKITYQERIIPTTTITASIAGALACSYALRFKDQVGTSKRVFSDTITGRTSVQDLFHNPLCPTCSDRKEPIILKASPEISTCVTGFPHDFGRDDYIITSEPILTEYRCISCHPKKRDSTKVFALARKYNSQLVICPECGKHSVDITIKDKFSINELSKKHKGDKFPCKYVVVKSNDKKIIFNLEE